jgi:SAM-dependent MidA family methyltransferase
MTPLGRLLVARIAAGGPITLAEFMAEALLHPDHGYYATRDPFGRGGDFVTAPEISQMFGELVGLALAQAWLDQGAPAPFTLAELGPGRGTLMADLWRATARVPGFRAAARLWLVEASPVLRAAQAARLPQARHAGALDDLPEAPLFLIANEFLDALPVRQFRRDRDGWRERLVAAEGGRLVWGLSPPLPCPDPRFADDPPGTVVELCPALPALGAALAARMATAGAAIFIDYGGWRSRGDTLQALRGHAPEHPLASPGAADLTAHVDFEALARAVALPRTGLTAQGRLLQRLGIAARAARLAAGLTGPALAGHAAALRRLTHPEEMGSLFRALAFHAPGTPPPPGFDPADADDRDHPL